MNKELLQEIDDYLNEKLDRCARIAKRKYRVWPSAYASGAAVKCRKGKIWRGVKEEIEEEVEENIEIVKEESEEQLEEKKKRKYKPNFKREKEQGLHGWFARNQGKGWVNCRTGGPCGRESADKGGKYPACRPTMAQCKSAGKGPLRRKKSSKQISWTGEGIMNKEDILKIIKEELAQQVDPTNVTNLKSTSVSGVQKSSLEQNKELSAMSGDVSGLELDLINKLRQVFIDMSKRGDLASKKTLIQNFLNTLNKQFPAQQPVQEGLKYHIETKTSLFNPIYRPGSKKFNELMLEAKQQKNHKFTEEEQEWLSTDVGLTGIYEGQVVPLDLPLIEEETLSEAEYKGKQVPLGKPQRGGSKKFYVYVKDGDRVKKISFGDPNLSVKVGDPKRRASFVARHRCKEKNDRLTAGYWSCRIGRYPHLTGAKQRYTWW